MPSSRRLLPTLALALLAGAALPSDVAAHTCVNVLDVVLVQYPPQRPPECGEDTCRTEEEHSHDSIFAGCYSEGRRCPPEPVHRYVAGGVAGYNAQTSQSGETQYVARVWNAGTADCDHDGVPGEWDGDHETGVGGAFFGWGPWADEPTCRHGLNVHGPNVRVMDFLWGPNVWLLVGENDQLGPIVVTDFTTGEPIACETDGTIAPDIDADDCLSYWYFGVGTTCGPGGGDGGYWVFLAAAHAQEGWDVTLAEPATLGFIEAF